MEEHFTKEFVRYLEGVGTEELQPILEKARRGFYPADQLLSRVSLVLDLFSMKQFDLMGLVLSGHFDPEVGGEKKSPITNLQVILINTGAGAPVDILEIRKDFSFDNAEAFCIMKYMCPEGHLTITWNSRDGVTPLSHSCFVEGCPEMAEHVDWDQDVYNPSYKLKPGDWFWRDGTEEEARAVIHLRVQTIIGQGPGYKTFFNVSDPDDLEKILFEMAQGEEFAPGFPVADQYKGEPDEHRSTTG